MEQIYKYPRTRHIEGSKIQIGDEDLKNVRFDEIKGKFVVLEEKVDGANTGISFDENGNLLLQSRGHFLNGGYGERQFTLFKTWANCFQTDLYEILGKRYIMYGEWLYAKHTVFYDELTHYFMEFDIFDKEKQIFLSTKKRRELLKGAGFVESVLVLYEGILQNSEELKNFLGKSHFKSADFLSVLKRECEKLDIPYELTEKQTDTTDLMEGIYIKVENEEEVIDRLKFVRASFINTILDSETHWMNRPIVPNQLKKGIDIFYHE